MTGDQWQSVINSFLGNLPAILLGFATLVAVMRGNMKVAAVNEKVNGQLTQLLNLVGRLTSHPDRRADDGKAE